MRKDTTTVEWIAQREAIWEHEISPRFSDYFVEKFTKKQLSDFKRYYIKGKAPKWDRNDKDNPVPLVIRLWLDPDSSLDNWLSIRDVVFDGHEDMYDLRYELNYFAALFRQANADIDFNDYDNENGFFMGLEKRLVNFYFEHLGDGRYFRAPNIEVDKYALVGLPYKFGGMYSWLTKARIINKNKLSQFAVKYWAKALTWSNEEAFGKDILYSNKSHILELFYYVENFEFLDEDLDIRRVFLSQLKQAMSNDDLPEFIKHWWQLAQKAASLEELMIEADPFFTEIPLPEPIVEKSLKQKLLEKRSAVKKKRRGKLV
ncbi:hypothetical protein BCU84_09895 [Shewanella sp. 10N.286.51.B7]|uniref:hypothetical protein n=1 Tax=Shewanella sp. 10N.286.51.B7 TaxID=1880836 RepID=UPI000C84E82C|nr:hypothetical protein [Shewanella sp. 10N.286.51.B7]PMG77749.1 hypothetical protein BCU84_09895 [Shewanella sp. 10N.286.51.B7]